HDLAFERIQPEGESKVRVYIENVRFDHLVSWFQELAELGLDIGNIRVEKTSSGYVNAQGVIGKDL
ncbi:MAG: type II secretion system protein GspM, partial [bacterium]